MKIVLVNAPPRAGKDTVAIGLLTAFENHRAGHDAPRYKAYHHKMSESLKEGAHRLFGINKPHDHFEDVKDRVCNTFMGMSPRQVYIALSEDFFKPHFGKQAFGHIFVNRLRAASKDEWSDTEYVCVCSDLGFVDELVPLIDAYGVDNIFILHLSREDCDFSNDSRSYIKSSGIASKWLINDGTIEKLQQDAFKAVQDWLVERHA